MSVATSKPVFLFAIAASLFAAAVASNDANEPRTMNSEIVVNKITPILMADDVEACVEFWASFGLSATVTVPHKDRVGFAILSNGSMELMYQSFASANADGSGVVDGVARSIIYLEVQSLDAIVARQNELDVIVPPHETSYGAREIYVRDPYGNIVGFSQQGVADSS